MRQQVTITKEMLKDLTLNQAKQFLNKDFYTIEKKEAIYPFECQDKYMIHNNEYYSTNNDKKFPYRKIEYNLLYLTPSLVKQDESFEYYNEKANHCEQYVSILSEKEFLNNIKEDLEGAICCPMSKTTDNLPKGKYVDMDEEELVKILNKYENIYEVAFVIYGYIDEIDAPIGDIECSGTIQEIDGQFHLKDGRACFSVVANSPEEAYEKAADLFDNMDVGNCTVIDSKLEHISQSFDGKMDKYWYEEDLNLEIER